MKARKRFGQHFLEPAWARKLLDVVQPQPEDVFLEIGPGLGALTLPLAPRAAKVFAIEIDRDLAATLARAAPANVQVITADFLDTDVASLLPAVPRPIRVVGSLPYNVSSPILFRLLALADDGRFARDATLMLQREVAERIAARPGGREYGILTVLTQWHAEVARPLVLPPGAFRPAPAVMSAVIHLTFRAPRVAIEHPELLEQMVRAAFGQRRKTLGNALKAFGTGRGVPAIEALAKAGIDARRRPETLDMAEQAALTEVFASGNRPDVL